MKPNVSYAIRIKFQYKLSDHLEGFYVSTYKDKEGNERSSYTTFSLPFCKFTPNNNKVGLVLAGS